MFEYQGTKLSGRNTSLSMHKKCPKNHATEKYIFRKKCKTKMYELLSGPPKINFIEPREIAKRKRKKIKTDIFKHNNITHKLVKVERFDTDVRNLSILNVAQFQFLYREIKKKMHPHK